MRGAQVRTLAPALRRELDAFGVAGVLVYLRDEAGPGAALSVLRHFVDPGSGDSAGWTATEPRAGRTVALRSRGGGDGAGRIDPGHGAARLYAVRFYPNLNLLLGTVSRESLSGLEREGAVARVTAVPRVRLIQPVERYAAGQVEGIAWGLEALGIPELWGRGLDGAGIRVAHLDTGVDGTHPALAPAIAAFAHMDDFGREVTPPPDPFDSDDHGTHTAATIAGRPFAGRQVGVAPGAELLCAAVIEGGDVVARVLGGMDWAVAQGARVLNMSLGFPGWWDEFLTLTRLLRRRGILPVMASGNDGPGTSRSPGNYAEALAIGASDRSGCVAPFSSSDWFARERNPLVPDLVAPGVGILSARAGGGYQFLSGTSMAAPHIAGLAALLWQARPDATADEIEAAIFASCEPLPCSAPERQGWGLPSGPGALAAL